MKRSVFVLMVLWMWIDLRAAQAQKSYRIASLNTGPQFVDSFNGFKSRMEELGYKEGRDTRYDFYDSPVIEEVLDATARKIVQDRIDLIVTSSTTATLAAAKATQGTNIPVVFLSVGNPHKVIKSFSGSGSNLAGISSASLEITGKRFELLRDLAPSAKRVAVVANPQGVKHQACTAEITEATKKLGFNLVAVEVTSSKEIANLVPTVNRKRIDAIYASPDALITEAIGIIVEHSIKEKLPVVPTLLSNVRKGCLATYAVDYFALGQQGSAIAHKILKGAKPADLPIEQPAKLNLVINLKTAKAIGLKVPREILLMADEVIE